MPLITSDIHVLNGDGEDTLIGTIQWDGRVITSSMTNARSLNDLRALNTIMHSPIMLAGGVSVDPKTEPERWIKNLYKHYNSPYLRATKAVEA